MAVIFIIFTGCFFELTTQHFISPVDPCILAKACHHTQIAQCGKEIQNLGIRWFLDECDMLEYNCDHKKEYMQIEMKNCPTHTSQNPAPLELLSTETTHVVAILTEASTHGTIITQQTRNSNDTTTSITPRATESSGTTTVPILTTSNLTTSIYINVASDENTKHTSTNETAASSTSTNALSESLTLSTSRNLPAETTLITSTDAIHGITVISTTHGTPTFSTNRTPTVITNTSRISEPSETTTIITTTASNETPILAITTMNTSSSIDDINQNSNPGDRVKITEELKEVNNTTDASLGVLEDSASTIVQHNIFSTSTTEKLLVTNLATNESAEVLGKLNTVNSTNHTDISTAASPSPIPCGSYPKECNIPVTWETTVEGETRDFFQILRERLGNQVQLLRGTTHWSSRRLHKSLDKRNSFLFGRHSENTN